MAMGDLPDMYARSPRAAGPRDEGIHIRICMPEARGPQARGMRVYISGKSRMAMLQLLCITLFP